MAKWFIIGTIFLILFAPAVLALSAGDVVEVIDAGSVGLKVRDAACGNWDGTKKFDGARGSVLQGPTTCGGYTWWKIRWSDGKEGWSAEGSSSEQWLRKITVSASTKFSMNDRVRASNLGGANLNVRYDPPNLAFKGSVNEGTEGTVVGGPYYGVVSGGGFYHFWNVNFGSITGWAAENYLTEIITSVPSAPQNPSATGGDQYVDLSWQSPASNGGATITGYKIYRGTSSSVSYYTTVSGTSYRDTAVSNGVTYFYRMSATNSAGEGPQSTQVSATPSGGSSGYPPPPTPLTPQNGAVIDTLTPTLTWSAVSGANLYYLVLQNAVTGSDIVTGFFAETQYLVPGGLLTDGGSYRWKLQSRNSYGWSQSFSEIFTFSVRLSSGSVPSAPRNLQASAGDAQVSLSWQVPSNNGGSAITGYKVYRGPQIGPVAYLTTVTGTSFVDTGLTNGNTYQYGVTALNSVGESVLSSLVSATPAALPQPTTVSNELLAAIRATLEKEVPGSYLPVEEYGDYGMGPGCTFKIKGKCRSTPYDGGVDYKGRGYIQLTHKYNYQALCGADCIGTSTPALNVCGCKNVAYCTVTNEAVCPMIKAKQPQRAGKIFMAYYRARTDSGGNNLVTLSDQKRYYTVGLLINGGKSYANDFETKANSYLSLFQQYPAKTNALISCMIGATTSGCGPGVFPELFTYSTSVNQNLYNALYNIGQEV